MKLFEILKGIEQGISKGDKNLGVYLKKEAEEKEREEKKLSKLLAEMEKQEEKRKKEVGRQIKLKKEEDKILKSQENKFLAKMPFLGKALEDPRRKDLRDEIEELVRLEQGLDDTELPTSLSDSIKESSTSDKNKIRPKSKDESHLTDQEYEQGQKLLKWFTGGKMSDLPKSLVSGAMELGEGASGLVGAKGLKQKIRSGKEAYEDFVGIDDRDAFWASGGRFLGEMPVMGALGKVLRGLPLLNKLSKARPILKHTGAGSLYGAIQAEKDDGDPIEGALIGGALGAGTSLAGSAASKLKGNGLGKIKKRASITDPEEVLRRAEVMGEKATIPELVGDEKGINRLKRDTSRKNISRMESVEDSIKGNAKKIKQALPQGEEEIQTLYKELQTLKGKVGEESAALYGNVKEFGLGKEGILEPGVLKSWLSSIKEHTADIKGLPKMKVNGGSIKDVEKLMQFPPTDPKSYRDFYVKNIDQLPTADDFLKYRKKVKDMLSRADSTQASGLIELNESLDRIVKNVDRSGSLAKADKHYATKAGSLNQDKVKEAINTSKFKESEKGRPKISKVFSEQSAANSQVFEQLSTEDKKRVLGGFLNEALKEEKHPARAIADTWKALPDYIKLTDDSSIQNLLQEIKTMAGTNKTLSSLQRSTTADIGGRPVGEKISKKLRPIMYTTSLLTEPTSTAVIAAADLGLKGVSRARNATLRKKWSQKNLKHYLKPELLNEVMRQKKLKHRHRLPIKLLSRSKERDDEL